MKELKSGIGIYFREYSNHPDKPLLVYLHGAGEKGNTLADLSKLNNVAFVKYFVPKYKDQFTILCPQQVTARSNWDGHETMHGSRFIGWAMDTYKHDGRVYVTGHSMGGRGTWDALATHKAKITAAVVSAGNSLNYQGVSEVGKLKIPVIHYHGSKDTAIPYSNPYSGSGTQVCKWYKNASGIDPMITLEGQGHGIDGIVYRDKNVGEWFLQQGTPNIPQPVPEPEPQPEPEQEGKIILRGGKVFVRFADKEVELLTTL